MKLGHKIGLSILVIVPIWIFIRAQLIYREGPKVIKIIEKYKVDNNKYPETLQQIGVRSFLHPMYFLTQKNEFTLMYSIFVYARWYYSSEKKEWGTLD